MIYKYLIIFIRDIRVTQRLLFVGEGGHMVVLLKLGPARWRFRNERGQ